ncbi:MAG: SGNH/GDSL hydrolase family protein [Pseudomonadota bacterium]
MLKALALSPVLVPQALWTVARAVRLPEAAGDRSGVLGSGPRRSLLIVGDSSAAGVGVAHQSDSLAGQLAADLAKRGTIEWKLVAKSGATVKSTLETIETVPPEKRDLVIIALGVNDVKNGVRLSNWKKRYRTLLRTISERFDHPLICVSGVPNLRHFTLLPKPLNLILGERSERFDATLRAAIGETRNAFYLPMDFPLEPESMAVDGFHPGPNVYREWARRASVGFSDRLGLGPCP